MTDTTLAKEIIRIVKDNANDNPPAEKCTVIRTYPDDPFHVDVETDDGTLRYTPCLFNNMIGHNGIIIYLDGDLNNPIALIDTRGDD